MYDCATRYFKKDKLFGTFVCVYIPLLDSCIRANYRELCPACRKGKRYYHLCGGTSGTYIEEFGSKPLEQEDVQTLKKAWKTFIDKIKELDLERDQLLEFMRECHTPYIYIDENKELMGRISDVIFHQDLSPISDDEDEEIDIRFCRTPPLSNYKFSDDSDSSDETDVPLKKK